jgi:hypothetical protein
MKVLEKFINQVILEELEPEADEDDVFGKWLEPEKRSLPVKEPNTPEENNAIKALHSFMGYSNDPSRLSANDGKYANMFLDLMKKHKYQPVLDPDTSMVYRGLGFDKVDQFMNFIATHGVTSFTTYDIVGNELDTEGKSFPQVVQTQPFMTIEGTLGPFVLNPAKGSLVQSWSEVVDIACGFANQTGNGGIVLRAITEENDFFGTPGELAVAAKTNPSERETISVGPVKVAMGMFVYSRKFVDEVTFIEKIQELER